MPLDKPRRRAFLESESPADVLAAMIGAISRATGG
jgi:hypothetical protein